jgi:hypothetical protein
MEAAAAGSDSCWDVLMPGPTASRPAKRSKKKPECHDIRSFFCPQADYKTLIVQAAGNGRRGIK